MASPLPLSFPEEVLEHIFSYLTIPSDFNSTSLICKSWYATDRYSRQMAFIGSYSLSPQGLVSCFPNLRSVEITGKPHFADFDLIPKGWGGYFYPWVKTMSISYPWFEEIRLKRMVVSDESLELIGRFSTDGLAAIIANCRWVSDFELRRNAKRLKLSVI